MTDIEQVAARARSEALQAVARRVTEMWSPRDPHMARAFLGILDLAADDLGVPPPATRAPAPYAGHDEVVALMDGLTVPMRRSLLSGSDATPCVAHSGVTIRALHARGLVGYRPRTHTDLGAAVAQLLRDGPS